MSGAAFHRVVVATDFSPLAERAFAHGLALALMAADEAEDGAPPEAATSQPGGTALVLVHVGAARDPDWERFPGVRETLTRWALLPEGSSRRAVRERLALDVRKVELPRGRPARRLRAFTRDTGADLVVLATRAGRAGAGWRPSVAGRVASAGDAATLRVPEAGRDFVDAKSGTLGLRRILIPVDHAPSAAPALALAAHAAGRLGDPPVRLALLHVGAHFPALPDPEDEGVSVERIPARGDPETAIRDALRDFDPDLLVLPTRPRRRAAALLRRGLPERVARAACCPVLTVPAPD